jgi:hypothetical protein
MAKKCIPGVFCIENMTLFILLFVFLILILLFFFTIRLLNPMGLLSPRGSQNTENTLLSTTNSIIYPPIDLAINDAFPSKNNVFTDPYYPPLKDNIDVFYPPLFATRGIPINIETQRTGSFNSFNKTSFNQVGILTQTPNLSETTVSNTPLILPVFGRNLLTNRDKWQYYTLSNTGNISSKLPIRVKGKDGMTEYGVDEIYNGDSVYVQGYNDNFIANIYDSRIPSYIPY